MCKRTKYARFVVLKIGIFSNIVTNVITNCDSMIKNLECTQQIKTFCFDFIKGNKTYEVVLQEIWNKNPDVSSILVISVTLKDKEVNNKELEEEILTEFERI